MDFDPKELRRTTLSQVRDDHAFFMCRGDRISHVRDLANCIDSLSDAEFRHHVSEDGGLNDFSVWIHDVLHNPLLARDVMYAANVADKHQLAKTIRDHITWLETV